MDDKDWDCLTPSQQKAAMAKFRAVQRRVQAAMKREMAEMAAFVRRNPSAVIQMDGHLVARAGEIGRYVFHIEVDADRFERYQAERTSQGARHG